MPYKTNTLANINTNRNDTNNTLLSPIKNAYKGKGRKLSSRDVIPFLYAIENPRYKGINIVTNTARSFDDGFAETIGAGVAETSNAPAEWFTGKPIDKRLVDDYSYDHLVHDDDVIRNAYDTRFGTIGYPNPSDTLSFGPRLYMAQNRYQRGNLGGSSRGRDVILDAVASGNSMRIIQALSKYGAPGDRNRLKRVVNARPIYKTGGSIHIKPENRGKFTETMRRTGKTAEELSHSSNPLTRKRAIFALNARKWNH